MNEDDRKTAQSTRAAQIAGSTINNIAAAAAALASKWGTNVAAETRKAPLRRDIGTGSRPAVRPGRFPLPRTT